MTGECEERRDSEKRGGSGIQGPDRLGHINQVRTLDSVLSVT